MKDHKEKTRDIYNKSVNPPIIKVMVFNIQAGVGVTRGYWQYLISCWKYFFKHTFNFGKINKFIDKKGIDIIGLLESSKTLKSKNGEELIYDLTDSNQSVSVNYTLWKIFKLRNTLFTSGKILSHKHYNLLGTGERRPFTSAILEVQGRSIRVFITHLSLLKPIRTKQIHFITNSIKNTKEPLILLGDFNTENQEELSKLHELGLERISLPTYPSWDPKIKLDSIFINNRFKLIASYTPDLILSDHLPLVAELTFK